MLKRPLKPEAKNFSAIETQITGNLLPSWIRMFVRSRETGLVLAAVVIGIASGGLVALIGWTVQTMHEILFALPHGERLSAALLLPRWRAVLIPMVGGLTMAALARYARRMSGRLADAIEANALFGGRLSLTGSLLITIQTVISCGTGASVGLEAGYVQISAAVASRLGLGLAARRGDLRMLVACGAAGAIAAAFKAPLAGAFYGFEVVLGTYTVASLVPVAASALVASQVAGTFESAEFLIRPGPLSTLASGNLVHVGAIGAIGGFASILLMLAVAGSERSFKVLRVPAQWRIPIGGALVGGMGLLTPQVLGSGHGAMTMDLAATLAPMAIFGILLLKGAAAAVSLGSGFRGGLFYASLLIGALIGRLYAALNTLIWPDFAIDPDLAALTAMAALGTGVIGAPIAMVALTLEATGNLTIMVAALIAALTSSLIVRELFGYSFAMWRFHLRGESIRGPHDVGWIRDLSVKKLMRSDVKIAPDDLLLREARQTFPLGSLKQIAAVDGTGGYAGIVTLDDLHTAPPEAGGDALSSLCRFKNRILLPRMTVREALKLFEQSEADALVVVDNVTTRYIVGILTEAHALRRYGEEMERQQPDDVFR